MQSVLIVIHLLVVIALVAVVLLQRSEGGALGAGGGGGFMTGRGQANALTRATMILATLFFASALLMSMLGGLESGAAFADRRQRARLERLDRRQEACAVAVGQSARPIEVDEPERARSGSGRSGAGSRPGRAGARARRAEVGLASSGGGRHVLASVDRGLFHDLVGRAVRRAALGRALGGRS